MGQVIRFGRKRKRSNSQRGLFEGDGSAPPADLTLKPARRSDARPAAPGGTDAVRSRDDDRFGEPSEEVLRRRRARRRTASAALVALFLGGAGAAVFAERGYLDVREKGLELERVRIEHALQEKRVLDLKQAVGRLRDHRLTIERIARERLGYVKPGELTLVLVEDGDAVVDGP